MSDPQHAQIMEFCSFYIGSHFYGVNIHHVKEVNREGTFTQIAHAPPAIRGYVNIRGTIYLVIDMKKVIGLEENDCKSDANQVILFKNSVGENFGILVDRIGDVIAVDHQVIERHGNNKAEAGAQHTDPALINGTCKLPSGLMTILAAEHLLDQFYRQDSATTLTKMGDQL